MKYKQFEAAFENTQLRKIKQMQLMRLYIKTSQHLTFFVFFSQEEQEEGRGQEEEVGEAPGLPSTPGGGKGTSSKQVDGGARCCLPCSFYESHQ